MVKVQAENLKKRKVKYRKNKNSLKPYGSSVNTSVWVLLYLCIFTHSHAHPDDMYTFSQKKILRIFPPVLCTLTHIVSIFS